MQQPADTVWLNANIATMVDGGPAYGMVESAAIGIREGSIAWIGRESEIPDGIITNATSVRDCAGRLVTPGLIDCHTHLIFAGNRSNEFEQRLNGVSYEQIARSGGGIKATVEATRQASEQDLYEQALPRVHSLMDDGVTTVEIKSGYGLDTENELKMLRVGRRLGEDLPLNVTTTFLGAHAVPQEYSGRADEYVDLVCTEMLPNVAAEKLADAVDAFCEGIAFSPAQVERVFVAAKALGLDVKCHAEQLSNLGGAVLAARYDAVSVDHLEYLHEDDVIEIARSATVAVLLPGAFYFLRETKHPPVAAMRRHHVHMAIATDANPGSSPVWSLTLMLNMACTLFGLTPQEALSGVTRNAARALVIDQQQGTIEAGKKANLALWKVSDPAELSYRIGDKPCEVVMVEGRDR